MADDTVTMFSPVWEALPEIPTIRRVGPRIVHAFEAEGIINLGDLVSRTEQQILRSPNLGHVAGQHLREHLARIGLWFGMGSEHREWRGPPSKAYFDFVRDHEGFSYLESAVSALEDAAGSLEFINPDDGSVVAKLHRRYNRLLQNARCEREKDAAEYEKNNAPLRHKWPKVGGGQ